MAWRLQAGLPFHDNHDSMSPLIKKRQGAYLPHWTRPGGTYAVCFRLGDSLSQERLRQVRWERKFILANAKVQHRTFTLDERCRLSYLYSRRIEAFLQNGHGACWLRQDDVATLVVEALHAEEGHFYRLFAWCVMPNHVHVVVQPYAHASLPTILNQWKGTTARYANRQLGRDGHFWAREYYDHLIRTRKELLHHITYTWNNPMKAGLQHWKWRWKISNQELAQYWPEE